jgi:hypothetical protein
VSITIGQYINKSGIYQAIQNNQPFYSIGINYNQNESSLQFFNDAELTDLISQNAWTGIEVINSDVENIGTYVKKLDEGNEIWWYLIIVALIFLFTESLLTGLWKM